MTKNQITKRLTATIGMNGIVDIERDEVEVYVTINGEYDYEATDARAQEVMDCLRFSGFRTGSGSWICKPNLRGLNSALLDQLGAAAV